MVDVTSNEGQGKPISFDDCELSPYKFLGVEPGTKGRTRCYIALAPKTRLGNDKLRAGGFSGAQ